MVAAIGAAALCGLVAFGSTYSLRGPDRPSRAADGDPATLPDGTPVPGTTPDTSQPFWWVPYQNAGNLAKKFEGERNGVRITLNPELRLDRACPGEFRIAPPKRL